MTVFKVGLYTMQNQESKIEKIIAALTLLTSVIVLFGWVLNLKPVLSILPHSSTMKFNTALLFFFQGFACF